jgi:hypothetical protein
MAISQKMPRIVGSHQKLAKKQGLSLGDFGREQLCQHLDFELLVPKITRVKISVI